MYNLYSCTAKSHLVCANLVVLRILCKKSRCFSGKFTQLAKILHDRRSWRSWQISTLLKHFFLVWQGFLQVFLDRPTDWEVLPTSREGRHQGVSSFLCQWANLFLVVNNCSLLSTPPTHEQIYNQEDFGLSYRHLSNYFWLLTRTTSLGTLFTAGKADLLVNR